MSYATKDMHPRDEILRKMQKDSGKSKTKRKLIGWGLGLGIPAVLCTGILLENKYGIVKEIKEIPSELPLENSFEFYPGEWKKEYVDCNSDAGLNIFNISKELSGLPEGDYGYWQEQITRKNPNGINQDSGGCYLWVPEDYKGK